MTIDFYVIREVPVDVRHVGGLIGGRNLCENCQWAGFTLHFFLPPVCSPVLFLVSAIIEVEVVARTGQELLVAM